MAANKIGGPGVITDEHIDWVSITQLLRLHINDSGLDEAHKDEKPCDNGSLLFWCFTLTTATQVEQVKTKK